MQPDQDSLRSSVAYSRRRVRVRFRLATLLVLVAAASAAFAMLGPYYRRFARERPYVVPTEFDFATGRNVLWSTKIGSASWGGPVAVGDKVFIGTNNAAGLLPRYPAAVDLGVLACFRAKDGAFLWQASSEKLPTGRVHDWPLQGVTSTPYVEGDRLWYVTNRCEVVCLDVEGFYDGEDDGEPDFVPPGFSKTREADVVWRFDMRARLGVSPHNASCSGIAASDEAVFVVTGNGVGDSHTQVDHPAAPSFLALAKYSGELLWSDDSPGANILHGQWGTPTYAFLDGAPQVLFPGGDGWLYSFDPRGTGDGDSRLLWKFDCNPKEATWKLHRAGENDRLTLLEAPTVHDGLVYIALGDDPEHGEGLGRVWCIDPTRRGDVSPMLVFNQANPATPVPPRREQACDPAQGDFVRPNPNSAAVWEYTGGDWDDDGEIVYEEKMHRSLSGVAVQDGLAFVTDYSGFVHCIDAKTGEGLWGYDLLAASWSTPLVSARHVYVADEDGLVSVFRCSADPRIALPGGRPASTNQLPGPSFAGALSADNVLYVASRGLLLAVTDTRP